MWLLRVFGAGEPHIEKGSGSGRIPNKVINWLPVPDNEFPILITNLRWFQYRFFILIWSLMSVWLLRVFCAGEPHIEEPNLKYLDPRIWIHKKYLRTRTPIPDVSNIAFFILILCLISVWFARSVFCAGEPHIEEPNLKFLDPRIRIRKKYLRIRNTNTRWFQYRFFILISVRLLRRFLCKGTAHGEGIWIWPYP